MELNIKDYFAPILKWWWLLVVTTAVAAGTSYFATDEQQPVYRTTTTLIVGNAVGDENPTYSEVQIAATLARFYVDMANRNDVRSSTADALGISFLPGKIAVRQVNDIFIDITVTDTSPERAQAVANELARQLILRTPSPEGDNSFVSELLTDFENQINQTTGQIELKQQEIAIAQGAREIAILQEELNALSATKDQLTKDYTELLQSSGQAATNTIVVIEPAILPYNPITNSSSKLSIVLVAGGVGLVLAATAAYILEYLDDTVRTSEALTELTGFNTLTGIAEIRTDNKLVTQTRPRSPISEAFRELRTAIQFAVATTPQQKVFLVSSAVPEEGKSTTAANLAIVLAQAGHKTLLVDADLRRPSQHKMFSMANNSGLTNLLIGINPDSEEEGQTLDLLKKNMQFTHIDRLTLLSSGTIPPNPSELLGSKQMGRFLDVVSELYDFVILDSPPVLSVTDATLLSARAHGMILVARAAMSRKQYVRAAAEKMKEVNANILGYVFNALKPRSEGHNAYYIYNEPYYTSDDIDSDEPEKTPVSTDGAFATRL